MNERKKEREIIRVDGSEREGDIANKREKKSDQEREV